MIIYIIKHPETEFNKRGITQGHLDSPLTKKGELTAKRIAKKLKGKHISKIFSSDLGRCMQTSKIINRALKVKIISKKELREQNYGDFNGKDSKYIRQKFDLNNPDTVIPEGESFNQMKERVLAFIKKIREDQDVLIVMHSGCLTAILSETLKLKFNSSKCKNETNEVYILNTLEKSISKLS